MEMQENGMQKIPGGIVQMITNESFCRFKATGKMKRAMMNYDGSTQKAAAAGQYSSGWYYNWTKHITGEDVPDSCFLRISRRCHVDPVTEYKAEKHGIPAFTFQWK